MKKIDLGQTIQTVANVGVIAGIIFLAIELAQNTDALKSQTVQTLQAEMREIFDYPEGFVESAFKERSELTPEDMLIRRGFFTRIMRIYENQWYQYSRGYLDDELFLAYQQHLRITLGTRDYADLWELRKNLGFFHPGFVQYVDIFLANNPPYSTEEIEIP